MHTVSLQFALHGSVLLLAGLFGGLFFARAIKAGKGEVAWRVVHSGACAAGVMLLAIAVPAQWVSLAPALKQGMAIGIIAGAYLLCTGMYVAAIANTRGIPGGGTRVNRLVALLYGAGTALSFGGCTLLFYGLLRSMF
jgi:hypothetical protein